MEINIIENVNNTLNKFYNDNSYEYKRFEDYSFIKERLDSGIFENISSDRQKTNLTLKLKFNYIKRVGKDKGQKSEIIFTFYHLSGNIIRDDKNYIYEGTPGFISNKDAIKEFIYYFYFKFIITPDDFDTFKKEIKKIK